MRILLAMAVLLAGVLGAEARSHRAEGGGYGVWVRGYVRSNGTYVQPYHRARPGLGAAYDNRRAIAAGPSSSSYPASGSGFVPASGSKPATDADVSVAADGAGAETTAAAPNSARAEDAGPARCDDGVPVGIGGTLCLLN